MSFYADCMAHVKQPDWFGNTVGNLGYFSEGMGNICLVACGAFVIKNAKFASYLLNFREIADIVRGRKIWDYKLTAQPKLILRTGLMLLASGAALKIFGMILASREAQCTYSYFPSIGS